ncbi:MAG: PEP-CTERM sorting domain-containing protein [Pyrinomonadaceae bacterium]|nr:PEP-CTERM sorting domain-containing protein [Pyrinomonadaceae bacterium]
MKKIDFRLIIASLVVAGFTILGTSANAAPVKFKQIVQIVNANPSKANSGSFAKLRVSDPPVVSASNDGDGDGDKKKKQETANPQDRRVITTTIAEITDDDQCDCVEAITVSRGGIPKWPLFGLGAVPLAFIKKDEDPTPTPTVTPPTQTPTPQEPIPEPMTLLLFGTGLAGVGLAARKRIGKQTDKSE